MKNTSKAIAKARQNLHRPLHFESDSSLSLTGSSDSLDEPNDRHREKEHYDKLKINVNNSPGSKKTMFGEF